MFNNADRLLWQSARKQAYKHAELFESSTFNTNKLANVFRNIVQIRQISLYPTDFHEVLHYAYTCLRAHIYGSNRRLPLVKVPEYLRFLYVSEIVYSR
jgi:hypothetical protein